MNVVDLGNIRVVIADCLKHGRPGWYANAYVQVPDQAHLLAGSDVCDTQEEALDDLHPRLCKALKLRVGTVLVDKDGYRMEPRHV